MEIAAAGDRAVLVTLGRIPAAELHAAAVRVRGADGVLACIVGEESLYVLFRNAPVPLDALLSNSDRAVLSVRQHVIRVSFAERQAPDLAAFLTHASITRAAFLQRVADIRLTARFLGFRAGFAYLDGWPEEWRMPRRPTSRPVPRGSFAIAGAMAGFYPIDTPGGWNILGRTDAILWDPSRKPPNLIAAGDEITLMPVEEELDSPKVSAAPEVALDAIDILSGGQLAHVVSGPDYTQLDYGIAPGGPFDQRSAEAANLAVGNQPDAPLLECAMVGPRVRFHRRCVVAWFGARSEIPHQRSFVVEEGQEIAIGRLRGMRGYLAIGAPPGSGAPLFSDGDYRTIRVSRGPHDIGLDAVECEVTPQLNRVGIRMRPLTAITHVAPADMRSCGMQFGTIQLHPDGSLVAMGPDHPITGGYLQPFTVSWNERWKLGQLAPGDRVRFQLPNA